MTDRSVAKPRVLVFCRNYLVRDFRENVAPLQGEFQFSFLTDGRSPGTPDTRRRFYAALGANAVCAELDESEVEDACSRCRMLRNLPPERARRLLHAMATALAEVFDREQPQVVLAHLVDEYVTHLISVLARKRGVRYVNYFASYFPGLVQLTLYSDGTAYDVREPAEAEIDAALQLVSDAKFRQNYQQRNNYSLPRHVRSILRYGVKRVVFAAKSVIEGDPWNVHYAITPYLAERRYLRDFPRSSDFDNSWRESLEQLSRSRGGPVMYLPLAYFPEATTDYWVADRRILDYDARVLEMVRALAGGQRGVVVVKEHLHMLGARNANLYRELRRLPNVVSVPPLEYSNLVLEACDAVIMGSGSVGVEATVRSKPIFSYCDSSFWFRPARAGWLDLSRIDTWRELIADRLAQWRGHSEAEIREFLRQVLRSTVRRRAPGRIWPLIDVDDLRHTLLLS